MPQGTQSLLSFAQVLERVGDGNRKSFNCMLDLIVVGNNGESEVAVIKHFIKCL
jgi:hypothetical protein